jgi:hypothetical protein
MTSNKVIFSLGSRLRRTGPAAMHDDVTAPVDGG